MALKFSEDIRNTKAAAYEDVTGPAPILEIRTGAPPANCAAADSGTLLAEFNLPANWLSSPSGGAVSFEGGPITVDALASGLAGHFRLKSAVSPIEGTVQMQGTVSEPGDGGNAQIDNTTVAEGQTLNFIALILTEAGA